MILEESNFHFNVSKRKLKIAALWIIFSNQPLQQVFAFNFYSCPARPTLCCTPAFGSKRIVHRKVHFSVDSGSSAIPNSRTKLILRATENSLVEEKELKSPGKRQKRTTSKKVTMSDSLKTESNRTTKSKKEKRKKKNNNEKSPLYWKIDSDEVIQTEFLKFTVHGKPVPLRRHRTSRGFVYNPSALAQESFREVVQSILSPENLNLDGNGETFFYEEDFLAITVIFRLRRPRNHFIGNKAGPGRLRETAPKKLFAGRVDVDNLAKFVLDSLNGLVYQDDRQVVSLHATKVYDCDGECEGSTEVLIKSVQDNDMDKILSIDS